MGFLQMGPQVTPKGVKIKKTPKGVIFLHYYWCQFDTFWVPTEDPLLYTNNGVRMTPIFFQCSDNKWDKFRLQRWFLEKG